MSNINIKDIIRIENVKDYKLHFYLYGIRAEIIK